MRRSFFHLICGQGVPITSQGNVTLSPTRATSSVDFSSPEILGGTGTNNNKKWNMHITSKLLLCWKQIGMGGWVGELVGKVVNNLVYHNLT